MRHALLVAALTRAAPTAARAADFGEFPSSSTGDGVGCLRATGEPGGLAYGHGLSGRTSLLRATPAGLQPADAPALEPYGSCTEIALRPGGAGIATYFYANEPGDSGVRVLLREGGFWGAPVEPFGDPGQAGLDALAVDISDAGAAVVAALPRAERSSPLRSGQGAGRWEVTAVRRAPGGAFGPVETLVRRASAVGRTSVQAGVTAAGETVVAWSMIPETDAPRELWASIAAPGGAFSAPVRIGTPSGSFALAVGDGGHALLAFPSRKQLLVAERLPGAGFGSALPVGAADDPLLVTPAAAVRADGAAAVGWVDLMDGRVLAVVRPGPGGFGQPVQLARRVPLGIDRVLLDLFLGDSALEPEEDVQPVAVTFARGDRAVLAWAASAGRDGVFSIAPSVATVPLTGGAAQVEALGNGLRDVQGITPVVLADGAPAVAWIDEAARPLHLAVDGVDDAIEDGPAPRVRIGAPRRRVVDADEAIELPVTCSAACDVRVSAGKGAWLTGTELSLQRAGTHALRIHPELAPIARLDGKPIPVHVRFGAPGTLRPQSRTVMVRVRRRPGAPLPRVQDVRVRRDGDDVVVTWRTQRATEKENFIAYAGVEPRGNALGAAEATGSGRRFRATIRRVASARYVTVVAGGDDTGLTRRTTVEIKR